VLVFIYIFTFIFHPSLRALNAARYARGMKNHVLQHMGTAEFILCPSVLDMEEPHTPNSRVVPTGPMVLPVRRVSPEDYPELAAFLDRGRTVVLNMATLFVYTPADVRAICEAIVDARGRLASRGGFQVFWKLPKERFSGIVAELLQGEDERAVRIEEWIEPPMLAVLSHPNVVASLNHGGANSVHEAA
jgi:hypothetical protein